MPLPMPKGKNILVQFNERPANFSMPSMEISTDHYSISYAISGDRRVITPMYSFTYHSGDIFVGIPYLYHRTVPESEISYINYMIKFSPGFADEFTELFGKNIFDDIYGRGVWNFSEENQEKLKKMFEDMYDEYVKNKIYTEMILKGMLFRLLITIYENKIDKDMVHHKSPLTNPIINSIYYIEKNYSKKITLEDAANEAHFSVSHFSRVFHEQLGMPFSEYLGNVRLRHAKRLLINSKKSVMEIALETGYCSGDYLSTQFKLKIGVTPTKFRNEYKEVTIKK